jgi:hypothetical protein
VSFVTALLGTALLCLAFGDIALAQDAAPPVCGGKVLEKCTPNSGDTAWMLTSVALVLMMTIPGLGLFYGGLVRKKNAGDTVMTSFAVTCLVTILFALLTYSMAFRAGTPFVGGLDRMFLKDILSDIGKGGIGNPNPLAATIPESVYICFQMTFAIITPALIAGAFAERMKFSAICLFMTLWMFVVYFPQGHMVWGIDGLMNGVWNPRAKITAIDFAANELTEKSETVFLAPRLQLPPDLAAYDQILLMDLVEHLHDPEGFMDDLRHRTAGTRPEVIVTSANVAFFVTRIMLVLGQFNYSRKGILGLGHRRLFTFRSLRALLEQAGYEVLEARGVPAPYPLGLGQNRRSRALLTLNRWLIKLSKGLFAYQICLRARALPHPRHLLKETVSGSAELRAAVLARVA